jgi:hypothetical protein
MMNIVFSIALFAVLKWMFLQLFEGPQTFNMLKPKVQEEQLLSGTPLREEMDKQNGALDGNSGFVRGC